MAEAPAPKGEMDHSAIDENLVADRYLLGRLTAGERAEFEEHYLDCPVCLERLETIEGLRAGLKELPRRPAASKTAGAPGTVALFRRPLAAALLAACLALAALPGVLFLGRARRSEGELAAARAVAAEALKSNAALTNALERERTARASAPLAALVFTLSLTRSAGSRAPVDQIVLGDAREWTVLLLDRPDAPQGASVKAQLSTADGRPVGEPLAANDASADTLAVGIPPGILSAGEYVLTLVGAQAPAGALATYRFRAVSKA